MRAKNTPNPLAGLCFDNSYARLPRHFYALQDPVPVKQPGLLKFNHALAAELGLDSEILAGEGGVAIFSGNHIPPGAQPIALAYAGHQFGQFVPSLGDGRAVLLGEVIDRHGKRRDLQLKGSGQTPFSRGGDGRAALGPVIREYILSEAMHALGVPTTRSLAAVTTGENVLRDSALPGAVLTRVASSHVRIGSIQYFAARGDHAALKQLADYVIDRHYPALTQHDQPYLALLDTVIAAQAELVARWLHIGFIHGVMNTDNMTLSGETIDYGPCAFMDDYDPATVFSAIDHYGRYAYGKQGAIAQWNLARLAEALLPLLDPDPDKAVAIATLAIESFDDRFKQHWLAGLRRKLGLVTEQQHDSELIQSLLSLMQKHSADFTLTFRHLSASADEAGDQAPLQNLFSDSEDYRSWTAGWTARLRQERQTPEQRAMGMRAVNPVFIPRNHLVEQAIAAAVDHGDLSMMEELLAVLSRPYKDQPAYGAYALPPTPDQRVYQTFCGT